MGALSRYFQKIAAGDESRHAMGVRAWAESVEGAVPIANAPHRQQVRVAGVVRRLTVYPIAGREHLELEVYDGTGEVNAVLMGRRKVGGVTLATHVVIDGVIGEQHGELRMMNPKLDVRS